MQPTKCILQKIFVLQKALSAAYYAKPLMFTGLYNFKLGFKLKHHVGKLSVVVH